MPTVSRWFIKTGLVFFVAALVLGGLRWLSLLGISPGPFATAGPAHIHLFVFGWVTEMIIGVAIWLFPPLSRDKPRGHVWLAWLTYGAINIGLVMRAVAEPLAPVGNADNPWSWLLFVSAILQTVGGFAFVFAIWPRIKESGR